MNHLSLEYGITCEISRTPVLLSHYGELFVN